MQDFPRPRGGQASGDTPPQQPEQPGQGDASTSSAGETASPSTRPEKKTGSVGNAMKALFESSDVSIRRGDETRVMSRAQEALAEIQRKSAPPPPNPRSVPPPAATIESFPPGPRVDKGLWIVLAVGLFAIAGWMVAYAL